MSSNPTFSTAFPSSCYPVVKPNIILLSSEFDSYTPQCLFNSLTTTMRLSKRQLSLPLSLCFSTFSPRLRFLHFPGKFPPRSESLHTTGSSSSSPTTSVCFFFLQLVFLLLHYPWFLVANRFVYVVLACFRGRLMVLIACSVTSL